jgi:xanthine dehydrogenase accessory factor
MKNLEFWKFIIEKMQADLPVALLVVTANTGATPGKAGFKMAAAGDGALAGSIGGGKLEFDLVEEARVLLGQKHFRPQVQRLRLDDDGSPDANGMICGGEQSVLLYPIRPADRLVIDRIIATHAAGASGSWSIASTGMVWDEESSRDLSSSSPRDEAAHHTVFYQERIVERDTLFIIGGGHVSLALAQVMSLLDWRMVVIDDRPDVSTMRENRWADEKVISPFAEVAQQVRSGENSWVVIMTPSHRADEIVLRALVRLPLRYLGMMASRHKAMEILAHLRDEGVPEALLQRVRTPVGLPIASHTPAEIAVSIAAQLIQIRNQSAVHEL